MSSTVKEHEAVLRDKCRNGTLYRSDAKLAAWLQVSEGEVQSVLDELVAADVLRHKGTSSKGSQIFELGFPAWLTVTARRLYQSMLSKATASGVVNVTTATELAATAGIPVEKVHPAYNELRQARLVSEETIDGKRFPTVLRWVTTAQ